MTVGDALPRGLTMVTPESRMRPDSSDSAPSIASRTGNGEAATPGRAGEGAQRAGDRADAFGHRDDRVRLPLRRFGLAGVEKAAGILGIGADRGDRLVDLVRDAGGDLPENGKPVGLGEIVAQPADLGFGALALGDFAGERCIGARQLGRPRR